MSDLNRPIRAVAILAFAIGLIADSASAQRWRTMTSARQLWGTEAVAVKVEYGAGRLELNAADRPTLYRMEMRYDEERFSPVSTFDEKSRRLHLAVAGKEGRRNNVSLKEGSRTEISLTREVPLDIDLDFGAGEAEIDLGGLRIRRLDVSTGASETSIGFDQPNPIRAERVNINSGASQLRVTELGNARFERFTFQGGVGETTLDFTGDWQADAVASVKMGIGSVVLRFPRELGVKVEKSSFLTSFDADRMVKRGGSYVSTNWDGARHRLTIDIEAALGSIEVNWVD